MIKRIRTIALLGTLFGLVGSVHGQVLSIELVEIAGVDVPGAPVASASVMPGDLLTVEFFLRDWSPQGQGLRSYLISSDSVRYTSGSNGNVYPDLLESKCQPGPSAPCTSNSANAFISGTGSADDNGFAFIHSGFSGFAVVDTSTPSYRWTSALFGDGPTAPGAGEKRYLGTQKLRVSANAAGTFTVSVLHGSEDTNLIDNNDEEYPIQTFENLTLMVAGGNCSNVPAGQCCNPTNGQLTPISDNNACTQDQCEADGSVSHFDTVPAGQCCNPTNGTLTPINDANECTTDSCNTSTGAVTHTDNFPAGNCCNPANGTSVVIDDGNGCTTDSCNAANGQVTHVSSVPAGQCCNPSGGALTLIDDSNACTTDSCNTANGQVTHMSTTPAGQCCNPANGALTPIDDGDACTNDTCNPATGQVTHAAITPCNCTSPAQCPVQFCRVAACTDNQCVYSIDPAIPAGQCCNPTNGNLSAISDSNSCTVDACNTDTGAVSHTPNTPAGQCCNPSGGALTPINDSNACTTDSCDAGTGAVSHTDNTPAGQCCNPSSGTLTTITDNNSCTTDSCNAANGQVTHASNVPAGQCCNPSGGALSPISDSNACTTDSCNTSTGAVTHTNTTPAGQCCNPANGTLTTIADTNICTDDVCDAGTGAVSHPNNTNPCNDNNPCSTGDICGGGVCAGQDNGPDCDGDATSDCAELLGGTAEDCNDNLVPDDCDIAGGTSEDGNGNLVPDECELTSELFIDTDLTLLPMNIDLRQDHGPFTRTKAKFDIWNQNEVKLSEATRCIECWAEAHLSVFTFTPHFQVMFLGTPTGKARLDGEASTQCPGSTNSPLLGVEVKELFPLDTNSPVARAGSTLVGQGSENAIIRYDIIEGPETAQGGHKANSRTGRMTNSGSASEFFMQSIAPVNTDDAEGGVAGAPTNSLTVGGTSQKGSLLVLPKVEVKWDASGALTQDTFIELINDYPASVHIQAYLVNGDEFLSAVTVGSPPALVERAHPGCNWVDNGFELTGDQPIYWSANTGEPAGASPWRVLDPGNPPGRPDLEVAGGRLLRGYVVLWAVDASGREINWNHLSASATVINYADGTAFSYNGWAFQCLATTPQGQQCGSDPGVLNLNGTEYQTCPNRLLLSFFGSGSEAFSLDNGD